MKFTRIQGRRKIVDDNGVVRDPMWYEDDDTATVVERSYSEGWLDGALTTFAVGGVLATVAFGIFLARQG